MKNLLLALLLFTALTPALRAQDRQIQGIVYDDASKQRLNKVYIYNTRTDKGIYNNSKGEFTISVQKGDTLVVALQGYGVDTVTIKSQTALIFYLKPTSILLKEVVITDSLSTPEKRLEAAQKEYQDIYHKGNSKNLLSVGSGGAGVSIDALYSLLSKEGKNARFLQKIIERDYHDAIINFRYTKTLVGSITNLNGKDLEDFMSQYRPVYSFVLDANDYSFIIFIKSSYKRYMQNPPAYRLSPLKQ